MPEQVAPPANPPSEDAPRPADPPADRTAEPPAVAGEPSAGEPAGKPAAPPAAAAEPAADEPAAAEPAAAAQPEAAASAPAGLPGDAAPAAAGLPEQRAEEPEAKRSAGRKVLGVVGALLAIGVVAALKFGLGTAVAAAFDKDGTADAKAGDCLAELPDVAEGERKDASGAEVVACTSTEAVYTVVGRVDGQTEAQARTGKACEPFLQPGQEGYFFYNIKPGSTGYLLCLTRKAA